MIDYLVLVPIGYILGSLPFGIIVGWAFKRVDVREFGSGMTGMTNVLRTIGAPAAALVLALDVGKTVVAVILARILSDSHSVEAAAAIAVLVGHNWPVFTGFRGGRGTASGWGGLLVLSLPSGLIALAVAIPVVILTRYMSMVSIASATSGSVALLFLAITGHAPWGYVWFVAVGCPLVLLRHKDNIGRLFRGEERKLGQAAWGAASPQKAKRRRDFRWPRSA